MEKKRKVSSKRVSKSEVLKPSKFSSKIKKVINSTKKNSSKITNSDLKKVVKNEKKIMEKIKSLDPNKFKKLINTLHLFIKLILDYWNKKYTEIPWTSMALIVFAVLYFLMPFDAIPDFLLPPLGYLDDAAVVGFVAASLSRDLRAYAEWKGLNKNDYLV